MIQINPKKKEAKIKIIKRILIKRIKGQEITNYQENY